MHIKMLNYIEHGPFAVLVVFFQQLYTVAISLSESPSSHRRAGKNSHEAKGGMKLKLEATKTRSNMSHTRYERTPNCSTP